ncbi:MAG: glycoside hydrolase family 3 N-terminal domain-containing protein, partial [Candidatus Paceibacterota bacterium]
PLVAVDHEGGVVQRLRGKGFTTLASWRQNCQTDSSSRVEEFSQSASELNRAGVQIVFAPVVDVARANSFLGSRACTGVDEIVSATQDYVTSFAQYGILPVIKHFPGIGSLTSDPHNQLDSVSLEAEDTSVFNQILSAFPNLGVMTTHVVVENKTAGKPCSLSALCLQSFPTNFPQALIFTDALEMASAGLELESNAATESSKPLSQRAQEALIAGNDVLVFGETINAEQITALVDDLAGRYESEKLFRNRIDEAVLKILALKLPREQL